MTYEYVSTNGRSRVLGPLAHIASRSAVTTMRPLTGAVGLAMQAGMSLERRAFDRALDGGEIERALAATIDSARVQAAVRQLLQSPAARQAVDMFFDSGLFDRFFDRLVDELLASDALWRLVDEIAQSPAVTAAISQQGLGFADQVGGEVRQRSGRADDWLERTARRLAHRRQRNPPAEPYPSPS